jgi:hypothetical protein
MWFLQAQSALLQRGSKVNLCSVSQRTKNISAQFRLFGTVLVEGDQPSQASNERAILLFSKAKQTKRTSQVDKTNEPGNSRSKTEPSQEAQSRRNTYPVPSSYKQLLATPERAAADTNPAPDLWKQARKIAKDRLAAWGSEASPSQRRAARFHESLWIEELAVTLELQRWRIILPAILSVHDGLYQLDVSELSDQVMGSTNESGFFRGVKLVIRCSNGNEFSAAVQPGSTSGTILASASPFLAEAEGPFEIQFFPQRFPQTAMHKALDSLQAERTLDSDLAADIENVQTTLQPSAADKLMKSLPSSLNAVQKRAVAACLEPGPPSPLVIWGPPGTGKSTLAAFIVWHLTQQRPSASSILVAAPSNTGCCVV